MEYPNIRRRFVYANEDILDRNGFLRVGLLILTVGPLYAEDSRGPALISDTTVLANDSVLVRAAKNANAARKQMAVRSPLVIDNAYVRRGRATLSTSSGSAALPGTVADVHVAPLEPASNPVTPKERAVVQQRIQNLNGEMSRMAEEADQPYAGDVPEDRVDQRLNQIPSELNQAQRQLGTQPPPKPPE